MNVPLDMTTVRPNREHAIVATSTFAVVLWCAQCAIVMWQRRHASPGVQAFIGEAMGLYIVQALFLAAIHMIVIWCSGRAPLPRWHRALLSAAAALVFAVLSVGLDKAGNLLPDNGGRDGLMVFGNLVGVVLATLLVERTLRTNEDSRAVRRQ